jgi:hypothetical protein
MADTMAKMPSGVVSAEERASDFGIYTIALAWMSDMVNIVRGQ